MRIICIIIALSLIAANIGCLPKTGGCPNCRSR